MINIKYDYASTRIIYLEQVGGIGIVLASEVCSMVFSVPRAVSGVVALGRSIW